jgi:UDP-N-acetylmuramyl pentapeptide phosphotransferase/UDP-N-acetylglucosamine-1-phosphate transferase
MAEPVPVPAIGWALASLLIAFSLVRAAIGYAHRRGMLDQPGQRRSHAVATPRGGGIGIVAAALVCLPGCLLTLPASWSWFVTVGLWLALLLVAGIGWWDDHRNLPALPRLLVQGVSTLLLGSVLIVAGVPWPWLPLLVLAGVWSINLHNFMDGTDGLLAQQGIFVFAGLALLAADAQQTALASSSLALAAACLGFWCYNRAPARIFMGDVGSGAIGFLVFAMVAMLWSRQAGLLWPAAILCSSFVTDASLTLFTRILRGRRWYSAHREHLYQWLVRCGMSHAGAGSAYMAWNLLVALPLAALAWWYPVAGWGTCLLTYLAATLAWLSIKHRCLRRDLHKVSHVGS